MSIRVGYRAMIIDNDTWSSRLAQFLYKPEYNNKIIQSVSFLDSLHDALIHAEQQDFIYIDPFAFNMTDAVRFIVEVQARYPVKAFTLYRSGRKWQERGRELEGIAMPTVRLRTMLALDKDSMENANFGQLVRDNLMSMDREFQSLLQRSTFTTDMGGTRSGVWGAQDFGGPRPVQPAYDPGYAPILPSPTGYGVTQQQLRDLADMVAMQIGRPMASTSTHPLLQSPEISQLTQQVASTREQQTTMREQIGQIQSALGPLQQAVNNAQGQITAMQGTHTKQQETVTAVQRDQREHSRQVGNVEQRVRELEARLARADQQNGELRKGLRVAQWLAIGLSAGLMVIILVVISILLAHNHF